MRVDSSVHDTTKNSSINLSYISLFYAATHALAFMSPFTGHVLVGFCLALLMYLGRNLALIVSYHRYFSHCSFSTSRLFQTILAILGGLAGEGGVLWWAEKHRLHHRLADTNQDVHSPHFQGIAYSHSGWFMDPKHRNTNLDGIRDFARFPELVFLDRYSWLFQLLLAATCYLSGGWWGLAWGYGVSTVLVWHSTHVIQSVAHLHGTRDMPTHDESRNDWILGLIILGDGWHNNHHFFPTSARHGLGWYQIDIAYQAIRLLGFLGLVWNIHVPRSDEIEKASQKLLRDRKALLFALQYAAAEFQRRCQEDDTPTVAGQELRSKSMLSMQKLQKVMETRIHHFGPLSIKAKCHEVANLLESVTVACGALSSRESVAVAELINNLRVIGNGQSEPCSRRQGDRSSATPFDLEHISP